MALITNYESEDFQSSPSSASARSDSCTTFLISDPVIVRSNGINFPILMRIHTQPDVGYSNQIGSTEAPVATTRSPRLGRSGRSSLPFGVRIRFSTGTLVV